jgi:hypothetical protein
MEYQWLSQIVNHQRNQQDRLEAKDQLQKLKIAHIIRNIGQRKTQLESALRENGLILSAALKVKRNLPKGATFAAMNVSM